MIIRLTCIKYVVVNQKNEQIENVATIVKGQALERI